MIKFDCDLNDLSAQALRKIIDECCKNLSVENLVGVLIKVQLMIYRRIGGLPNEQN